MQINDPNGTAAKVTREGRISTEAVTASAEHHVNHHEGNAFNVVFSQSPTAADDCFFYMVNGENIDMVVEGITVGFINATAVDAEVYVEINSPGTRNSATALTPANLNAGSGLTAGDSTFEKGADLDGGAATVATGTEVERFVFADIQNLTSKHYNFAQDLILPKNKAMTIWATDAGATYYITVHLNFHDTWGNG